MTDEGAPHDSGFDDSGPFADTPPPGGVSLEAALEHFGPAAFEDLIPRLQTLAADLDEAHAAGFVHGRLHPGRILVTEDGTYLMGRRVPATATLTPAADQAAFAVIAYEWMFGRRVSPGAAVAPAPPSGVDRGRLSQALTRALSHDRERQFPTILDFVDALESAQIPELPLTAPGDAEDDPVEPFAPEPPADAHIAVAAGIPAGPPAPAPMEDVTESSEQPPWQTQAAPASWQTPQRDEPARFGGLALIAAVLVGALAGFAAGYMAQPRALRPDAAAGATTSAPNATAAPSATSAPSAAGAASATGAPSATSAPGSTGAGNTTTVVPKAAKKAPPKKAAAEASEPLKPVEAVRLGRLLIRSTPSGASVVVDGVARGETPVAIRDLDLGSRDITITRPGYHTEERRIVLTRARPSRSVDVRLTAAAAAPETRPATGGGAVRPSTPASFGKPAATTGTLAIESRPAGAAVLVNGKPSGTTPVTIANLEPGDYRVTLTLKGFREFATTVTVVAGERARAAARLTEQEQE